MRSCWVVMSSGTLWHRVSLNQTYPFVVAESRNLSAGLFASLDERRTVASIVRVSYLLISDCHRGHSPLLDLDLLAIDVKLDHLLWLLWRLRGLPGDCRGRKGGSGARCERRSCTQRGARGARRGRSPQHHSPPNDREGRRCDAIDEASDGKRVARPILRKLLEPPRVSEQPITRSALKFRPSRRDLS